MKFVKSAHFFHMLTTFPNQASTSPRSALRSMALSSCNAGRHVIHVALANTALQVTRSQRLPVVSWELDGSVSFNGDLMVVYMGISMEYLWLIVVNSGLMAINGGY